MPELPEVEASRSVASRAMRGQKIQSAWAKPCKLFRAPKVPPKNGALITSPDALMTLLVGAEAARKDSSRHGKLMACHLITASIAPLTLFMRMGMTGKLCTHRRYEEAPAGAKLTLYFDGDEGLDALTLVNTRMFGSCWAVLGEPERDREACEEQSRLHFEEAVKLAKMGPDALELARNPPAWISHLRGVSTRRPVKSILLDQEVVAGIGNIYAVEALFYAGVHPSAQLSNVSDDQLRALANRVVSAMEWTLKRAEEEGRVVYGEGRGERSPFTVYGREGLPCTRCESTLMNLQLGGRQTVFCPSCQPSINS